MIWPRRAQAHRRRAAARRRAAGRRAARPRRRAAARRRRAAAARRAARGSPNCRAQDPRRCGRLRRRRLGPRRDGRGRAGARAAAAGAPEPNWDAAPDGHARRRADDVRAAIAARRCVRSPHRDRDADAALGRAIALSYAQGPGAWGANEIIMPDGARFSMLEADPMKLTYY